MMTNTLPIKCRRCGGLLAIEYDVYELPLSEALDMLEHVMDEPPTGEHVQITEAIYYCSICGNEIERFVIDWILT
jgi:hypothetical protein